MEGVFYLGDFWTVEKNILVICYEQTSSLNSQLHSHGVFHPSNSDRNNARGHVCSIQPDTGEGIPLAFSFPRHTTFFYELFIADL